MNGQEREFIEMTAEVTARRLIDKLMERLPCEKIEAKVTKNERRIQVIERSGLQQYNAIAEAKECAEEAMKSAERVKKAIDGLWWKVFIAVVVPLAIFMFMKSVVL